MSRFPGYGQFCPVAKACEVLAERWTPLVVRELLRGSRRFVDIRRGIPLMSPSLLSQRLKELERAGIIERKKGPGRSVEYQITTCGQEMWPIMEALGNWGQRWAMNEMRPDEADAGVTMWDIRCRVPRSALPQQQIVLHFVLKGAQPSQRYWWLILDSTGADLCWSDPGLEIDLTISSSVRDLTLVWMGIVPLETSLRAGKIVLEGSRDMRSRFKDWFPLNYFAGVPRAREMPLDKVSA
jgi:DNA-binding HxlR family transcriptional regulator